MVLDLLEKNVIKKDNRIKASGESIYVGDYPSQGILVGKLLRSKYAKAKILSVKIPQLPEGYYYVDANDVPGNNYLMFMKADTPVFCENTVEYIGDTIGMLCGPDEKEVERLLGECKVDYEVLTPVVDAKTATENFFVYEFGHGNPDEAFSKADFVYEEEFHTGNQDQLYLEPQGMMAEPEPNGGMFIHGSLQCVYYVHRAVARTLGCDEKDIHVLQDATGGAFGGKEAYPSILGSQVAVAAKKANAPVRCIFDRREDLEFTSKRHPSICKYKAAIKDGKIIAMDCDITLDAGAYTTLTAVVLQRSLFASVGVYNIPNIHVKGRAAKTNTVPNGAFRGFGGPQAFFAMETFMNHVALQLGKDALEFKKQHLAKQGDMTSTQGQYHFPVPLPEMIQESCQETGYIKKREQYSQKQEGRFRRGIGMSLYFHGGGFTGNGERDIIKSVVKLRKYEDGRVEILVSNGDFGQGLGTTFPKIVAQELGIAFEKVFIATTDTSTVPDSGPTVASRSIMIVGALLRKAAAKLRSIWEDGVAQEVEERYEQPEFMIPFSNEEFIGDAYPDFSWGLNIVELEIDTLTGIPKVLELYGNYDVGTPIDKNILLGQLEGGTLQGLGFGLQERIPYDARGYIRNHTMGDYLVPTSVDVPVLKCTVHEGNYPLGPFGAKGAGELPAVGAAPAYLQAVEQALGGVKLNRVPFVLEDILTVIHKEGLA